MNMLYLIGNGFDLNLGLPTRYSDFLEYYFKHAPLNHKATSQESRRIQECKDLFRKTIENNAGDQQWKDLEIALGKFSSQFSEAIVFRDFYLDINLSLINYLKQISPISLTENDQNNFFNDFMFPTFYLTAREQQEFQRKVPINKDWHTNVVSFNYTSTFETLSKGILEKNSPYWIASSTNTLTYLGIKHIHGSLEENSILLGVDNSEQIENADFKDNEDVTDLLVKPQGNKNIGSLIDDTCHGLISKADLICLFGLSLGATDQTWWEDIKERFISDSSVVLLYFYHDLHSGINVKSDGRSKRKARAHLVKALGLEGTEQDYRDRIFVAVNSAMFSLGPKEGNTTLSP
jgi:hypothetical protein